MSFWSRLTKRDVEDAGEEVDAEESLETAGRYCRCDTARYPVGDDSHLVYSFDNRPASIIPSYMVGLLNHCRGFKTLEEHAESWAAAVGVSQSGHGSEQVEAAAEQLAELIEAGLLLSEREVSETCRRAAASSAPPPEIATVGVVTANRVDEQERCLVSFMENRRAHGRANDFVVADDSQSAEVRGATREMLAALRRRFGVDISYAGLEEKERFARLLSEAGDLPPEAVRFALFDERGAGFSGGKNRNALLLHTAGDMFYSTDDDAVCRLAAAPDDARGRDDARAMQWWVFPDRQATLDSVDLVDDDLLGIHELLLGRDLCECVAAFEDVGLLNLAAADGNVFRHLRPGAGSVLVTFTGLFGDSGAPAPLAYRAVGVESRERIIRSFDDYRTASFSREVLRLVPAPRVGRDTQYNTTAIAYDNRELLPPFTPAGRGEDYLFGHTLRLCFDRAFFGDLPWAVLHAPAEPRVFTPEATLDGARHVQLSGILIACVTSKRFWPGMSGGRERLLALGRHLTELGSMPLPEFEEFVRLRLLQMQGGHLASLEQQLKDAGSPPDYWAKDVHDYTSRLRESMLLPGYIVPSDLAPGRDVDDARRLTQDFVRRFGQLLETWPAMVDAARRLRAQGHRLAAPV